MTVADLLDLLVLVMDGPVARLAAAALVLVAGVLAAFAVKELVTRAVARLRLRAPDAPPWLVDRRGWVGRVGFWGVMLAAGALALDVSGLPGASVWLGDLSGFLPRVLTGLALGTMGVLAASGARVALAHAATAAEIRRPQRLARTAERLLLVVTALLVADHVGIDIGFLATSLAIVLATVLGAGALAFGLGARPVVENILASHYVRQLYEVGQTVRIGDAEGRIVRTTPVAVILERREGEVTIPAALFIQVRSERLIGDADGR